MGWLRRLVPFWVPGTATDISAFGGYVAHAGPACTNKIFQVPFCLSGLQLAAACCSSIKNPVCCDERHGQYTANAHCDSYSAAAVSRGKEYPQPHGNTPGRSAVFSRSLPRSLQNYLAHCSPRHTALGELAPGYPACLLEKMRAGATASSLCSAPAPCGMLTCSDVTC